MEAGTHQTNQAASSERDSQRGGELVALIGCDLQSCPYLFMLATLETSTKKSTRNLLTFRSPGATEFPWVMFTEQAVQARCNAGIPQHFCVFSLGVAVIDGRGWQRQNVFFVDY